MKKITKFIYASSVLAAVVAVSAVVFGQNGLSTLGVDSTSNCQWNHYDSVDSTYLDNGSKEYWVCCNHHEMVFEQPSVGSITDKGAPSEEFVKALEPTDARYDIKKTDHVVCIKANSIQSSAGKHTFATREKITGLQSISFDAKWENATTISWIGFGHASDITTADIYTGMKNFSCANDGEWHSQSITFDGNDEYTYFIAAAGEFNADATMLLRNIKITYSDGVLEESAEGTGDYFRSYYNSDYPELMAPSLSYETRGADGSNVNRALKLEPNKLSGDTGKMNVVSHLSYKGIKYISLRYKAVGGPKVGISPWSYFGISATPDNISIYDVWNTSRTAFSPTYDGEWHEVTLPEINGDGYLFFAAAIGEFQDGTEFYFDSVKISYYWNNCSNTESFNHDCTLFRHSASVRGNAWTTVPTVE